MKHKKLTQTIFGLLVLQFILGILANLYSTIPHIKPYDVFHQWGWINLHAINGTLLLILSIVLVVKARKSATFQLALTGAVNIVLAFTFGELFVFTQNNIFSFFMALAFIGAFASYARLVFSNSKS